jgi:PAS domain S-box-containing protein
VAAGRAQAVRLFDREGRLVLGEGGEGSPDVICPLTLKAETMVIGNTESEWIVARPTDFGGKRLGYLWILMARESLVEASGHRLLLILAMMLALLVIWLLASWASPWLAKIVEGERVRAKAAGRQQAEAAPGETEMKYAAYVQNAPNGVFVVDSTGKFVEVNPAFCRQLGYSETELGHLSMADLFSDDSREIGFKYLARLRTEGRFDGDIYFKCRDGGERCFLLQLVGLSFDRFIGYCTDIAALRQAEERSISLQEKLQKAERMESLAVLAGGVAHDLNNMLGPIVGYPEILLRKLPEDSPLRKAVQKIGKAAREAADVIQDLLTLARRGRYEMMPTRLNEVIESYLDSPGFAKLTEERPEVKVQTRLDEDLANIAGSTPHLAKVVMNLVVNAFDAMPDGGTVTIETSKKKLEQLLSGYTDIVAGDYAILRVRDTGIGIDDADLTRIFEPYYSKKKMDTSGSGLGLSVVYGIVRDHKGYYDVFSKPGEGTEFVMYFPVTHEAVRSDASCENKYRGTETVLVIDDSKEQCDIAVALLSNMGYRVSTVADGREAIEFVKRHPVDILVLDMLLEPGFDGLQTYQEIIELYPEQKAIIISGASPRDRVTMVQSIGAGAYIRKPYTMSMIGRAVREELDRPSVAAPAAT